MRWIASSLSARLLVLTVFFVMLSEVLIFAPSIARYRAVYLQDRLATAHLAALVVDATPDRMVSQELVRVLLDHAGVRAVDLYRDGRATHMLSLPQIPDPDETVDLMESGYIRLMVDAFATLVGTGGRMLKVMGASPKDDKVTVVALMPAAPLRKELVDYSWRILGLSIVISLLTASLVFVVLQAQIVAPMLRLTVNMVRFRPDREADGVSAPASRRSDEVGIAERTLIGMQEQLRTAFRQQAHLAALGSAVSKISHDLRNILSTVRLLSDRLANSDDPEVRRITPRLVAGVDRAVNLTQATLDFTADRPKLRRQRFALAELLSEVVADFAGDGSKGQAERRFDIEVPAGLTLDADRDQLFRALTNITRNATEAGANSLTYKHIRQERAVVLEIADDGPGVPEALRANLFDPFTSARPGGTGLGLAIARDLVQAHGGTVDLVSTGEGGSVFRVSLPDRY